MGKMFSKKGLSSIITSLILILLVLVAIGIAWIFIRNIISEESEEISISKFTINLEIKNVKIRDDGTEVTVERKIGKGDLVGIKFIIINGTKTETFMKNTTMKELETKTFILDYVGGIDEISILPILKTESGKIVEGSISDTTTSNIEYVGGSVGGGECTPSCGSQSECCGSYECGSANNGCGASYECGTCDGGYYCSGGTCIEGTCTPDCTGKECGDNGCGGTCGTCGIGEFCASGVCLDECISNCAGKECGDDGCGNLCGVCDGGYYCSGGTCIEGTCTPDCTGKECGDDGCGGLCGICNTNYVCILGICICDPDCTGKECGDNGCGGSCGTCGLGEACIDGTCIGCTPDCTGKECGDNGCGGSCGTCGLGEACIDGICVQETSINNGIIYSVWPPEAKIYFDSENLPKSGVNYQGYYTRFPYSDESRCIPITDFVVPYIPEIYNRSYIELGVSYTNIDAGDMYEVWETLEGCNAA